MAKTRRTRIDSENDHRRATRSRLRIIQKETRGYPRVFLRGIKRYRRTAALRVSSADPHGHPPNSLWGGELRLLWAAQPQFFVCVFCIAVLGDCEVKKSFLDSPGNGTFFRNSFFPWKKYGGSFGIALNHKPFRDPLVYPETLRDSRSYSIASDGARR